MSSHDGQGQGQDWTSRVRIGRWWLGLDAGGQGWTSKVRSGLVLGLDLTVSETSTCQFCLFSHQSSSLLKGMHGLNSMRQQYLLPLVCRVTYIYIISSCTPCSRNKLLANFSAKYSFHRRVMEVPQLYDNMFGVCVNIISPYSRLSKAFPCCLQILIILCDF